MAIAEVDSEAAVTDAVWVSVAGAASFAVGALEEDDSVTESDCRVAS